MVTTDHWRGGRASKVLCCPKAKINLNWSPPQEIDVGPVAGHTFEYLLKEENYLLKKKIKK